jgi:hypothetical protein
MERMVLPGTGKGQKGSFCKFGNEHSGSIKCGEVLEWP